MMLAFAFAARSAALKNHEMTTGDAVAMILVIPVWAIIVFACVALGKRLEKK